MAFVATCQGLKADIAATIFFPDHHHYTAEDIDRIQKSATAVEADTILTTLKDLVKIPKDHDNFWSVQIDTVFEFTADKQQVKDVIREAVR